MSWEELLKGFELRRMKVGDKHHYRCWGPGASDSLACCSDCEEHILTHFNIPEITASVVDGMESKQKLVALNVEVIRSSFLFLSMSSWQLVWFVLCKPWSLACVRAGGGRGAGGKKKRKMQLLPSRTLIFCVEECNGD